MSDELATHALEVEREHREARAALDAAQLRWERAKAETQKVCELPSPVPPPVPFEERAPSSAAIDGALRRYTDALKALATDESAQARERCARALAEYDALCAEAS